MVSTNDVYNGIYKYNTRRILNEELGIIILPIGLFCSAEFAMTHFWIY